MLSLSWSAFGFGSMATDTTGVGNVMDSRTIGSAGSLRVSPVVVCLRPTMATMSPVKAASLSSRWFACIWRMRPIRSLRPLVEFSTWAPARSTPE